VFTHSGVNLFGAFGFFLFAIGFGAVCLTVGRKAADKVIAWIHHNRLPEPASSLTFICLLGFFCGAITQKIGIHALFGFFIAGMMAGGAPALPEKTRQIISQMVYALFVPLFFVNIGLKVDFWKNFDLFLVIFFCAIGVAGRFYGAWFGVGLTKIDKVNRLAVSICHIPGGVMEIVVSLLALQFGLITERMFVAIVFSAVFSSVILGPWLNYAIRKRKRVSIMEFFSQRAVVPLLKPGSRDEALLKLCEVFVEQEGMVDVEPVYRAVLEREKAMGTALEEGVAVPHGRLDFIDKPAIVFGRSLSGIEWNSPDGKPAQLIFLIFTPPRDDVQVQILSAIARALSEKKARDMLLAARDAQGLWESLQSSMAADGMIKRRRRDV
jgi:mannitol/fructose-specific phosphotransferase system IIA component (Ntr-type)